MIGSEQIVMKNANSLKDSVIGYTLIKVLLIFVVDVLGFGLVLVALFL